MPGEIWVLDGTPVTFLALAKESPQLFAYLPCPLKLKRGEFRWKAVDDHLHGPWPVPGRLPCPLRQLAVVLPEAI